MSHSARWLLAAMGCTCALLMDRAGGGAEPDSTPRAEVEFFERKIRPVLVRECYECHSGASVEAKGGLRLDARDAIRRGGESGPAVVPGQVEVSLLISALRHDGLEMPPGRRLDPQIVADFTRWVARGAADPRDAPPDPQALAAQVWEAQYTARLGWWSLQPLRDPQPPRVENPAWSRQPIDRFIAGKLAEHGLTPAPRADRASLVRRVSLLLTGLPPTLEELARWAPASGIEPPLDDVVDAYLASPHFGEHWARHWMDVIRYTDTYGYEWDIPAQGAWRFRDYLVRAFNADVPFNQLVREQIAGDLLEQPRLDEAAGLNESLAGVMFYQLGEKRHGDSSEFNGIHQEMLDNKIDAFSKAFLAATVACARCHDHKLDPVPQRDYYALAGVFFSGRWVTNTLDLPARHAEPKRRLQALKADWRPAIVPLWQRDLERLAEQLAAPNLTADAPLAKHLESLRKTKPLESLLTPWVELTADDAPSTPWSDRWQRVAQRYQQAAQERRTQNAQNFQVVADFRTGWPMGWSADGVGLQAPVRAGDWSVPRAGERFIERLLPRGWFTHADSPRLNGALRSPDLSSFGRQFLSLELVGGDFAAQRIVYDNAFLTEKQRYLQQTDLGWLKIPVPANPDRRWIVLELATKTSNPNFPPRVGLGGACSEEQTRDPASWWGITRVVAHDVAQSPADELSHLLPLFDAPAPIDRPSAARRYRDWLAGSLDRWLRDLADDDDVRRLNELLRAGLLSQSPPTDESGEHAAELARRLNEYRAAEAQLPLPQTVNGLRDLDPGRDYPLNLRGDYDQLGPLVPRGFPGMIAADRATHRGSTSGRRELAELIADPSNPRTARVFVNRVWHWLFGAGLVRTVDDFGQLGEVPVHGELLDHLASRFIAEGWSLKKLVRRVVLSETFQQSPRAAAAAIVADPENRCWHHFPVRRLEAESLRDAMLTISGRLDRQLFGPPLDPPRRQEDPQKRLFSGPLDGQGRRSLYMKITIMEPPRFLATFNQPEPKIPTGQRDAANTPAQALALLNDPFVLGQAAAWAERVIAEPSADPDARLAQMLHAAWSRAPSDDELTRWRTATLDFARLHAVGIDKLPESAAVWRDVAHAVLLSKEFLYLR